MAIDEMSPLNFCKATNQSWGGVGIRDIFFGIQFTWFDLILLLVLLPEMYAVTGEKLGAIGAEVGVLGNMVWHGRIWQTIQQYA